MIGEKVKERRLELGMTQQELAEKVGYRSKGSINKIELNKSGVSQSLLLKLAEALRISPMYFIEDDLPPESYSKRHLLMYALMLSRLSERNQDSAIQYIKYLSDTEKQQQEQK